jgi:hypothetical protein
MNLNQIINMVIRLLMRRGINAGINKGINMARGGGKSQPRRSLTPEEDAEFQEFKRQKQLQRKADRRNSGPINRQ